MRRIDRLLALALQQGVLTTYVKNKLDSLPKEPGKFTEEFLKMKPGLEREKFLYNAAVAQGKPKNLVPVTIDGPNGTKIILNVTNDYLKVDNLRIPVAGQTGQKIADNFDMVLPTPKIVDAIYHNADAKIFTPPLSSGGKIGDRYYSGIDVVRGKISDSDSSLAYNQSIDKALEGKDPKLVGGSMKELIQPQSSPNKLGIYGWFTPNGTPLQPANSPHDTIQHSEYGLGLRLVDKQATIVNPDGSTRKVNINELAKDPQFGKLITDTNGLTRYNETHSF